MLIFNPITSMNAKSADQPLNEFNNDFLHAFVDEFSVILLK